MDVDKFLQAGKVPRHLLPWGQGQALNALVWKDDAFMFHVCAEALHLVDSPIEGFGGYTVMDDSDRELSRHLEAVKHAKGRVLKTGLGFGCFVRMCLLKPEVERIDVIEIDDNVIAHFGAEFKDNPRVRIYHGDALHVDIDPNARWDLAWHDIYCAGNKGLQALHSKLLLKYARHCRKQGAWQFPREYRKLYKKKSRWMI